MAIVGTLLDVYTTTLSSALKPSNDTKLSVDTVFKVRDLANSLEFLGTVTLNLAFSL